LANPSCSCAMIHTTITPMVHSYKKKNICIMYFAFLSLFIKEQFWNELFY
jgi:hypothetical protein